MMREMTLINDEKVQKDKENENLKSVIDESQKEISEYQN